MHSPSANYIHAEHKMNVCIPASWKYNARLTLQNIETQAKDVLRYES